MSARKKRAPRSKQVNIRLNDVEADRLDGLKTFHGVSASDVLRMIVKAEYDRVRCDLRLRRAAAKGRRRCA